MVHCDFEPTNSPQLLSLKQNKQFQILRGLRIFLPKLTHHASAQALANAETLAPQELSFDPDYGLLQSALL